MLKYGQKWLNLSFWEEITEVPAGCYVNSFLFRGVFGPDTRRLPTYGLRPNVWANAWNDVHQGKRPDPMSCWDRRPSYVEHCILYGDSRAHPGGQRQSHGQVRVTYLHPWWPVWIRGTFNPRIRLTFPILSKHLINFKDFVVSSLLTYVFTWNKNCNV